MNRIPGFTADLCISAPRRGYAGKAIALSGEVNSVVGQSLIDEGPLWPPRRCIPDCVCVGPYECPCCGWDSGGPRPRRYF